MYRYYREAEVCYSFLSDISTASDFSQSRWFTRGWTLQELIAPTHMIFFNREWQYLGTKASLGDKISERTGVPQAILSGAESLESASVAQRMSWAASRKTTRLEDRAYSLMGIFDINMPLLYGEGHKAFVRLQEEILRVSDDHSIFAWRHTDTRSDGGLLAETPDAFKDSKNIISWNPFTPYNSPFTVTNKGVHLDAPFIAQAEGGLGLVILHCAEAGSKDQLVGVYLRDPFLTMEHFERCRPQEFTLINLGRFSPSQYPTRNLCIRLRGKVSSRTLGSSVSKDQGLQPRHSTAGDQNSTTDGVEDAEGDEQEKDPQQKLFLAVSKGNEAVVKKLLALSDIDANSMNGDKRTPLSLAAEAGHERIVDLLLNRREVDINSRDKSGLSPLSYAAAMGHEKVVWILLARSDIEANSQDAGKRTAVSLAAGRGHRRLVEQLMARKDTQRHLLDGRGRSVLSYAAEHGHQEVVRLILGSGKVHPDLRDQAGCSALWYASKNGQTGLVKLLLETGWVDPNVRDPNGHTVLWHACQMGQDAIVELLLKAGADPCAVVPKKNPLFQDRFDSDTESLQSYTGSLPFPSLMVSSKKQTRRRKWSSSSSELSLFEGLSEEEPSSPKVESYFPPEGLSPYDSRNQETPGSRGALWQAASGGYHVIVQLLLDNYPMPLDSYDCFMALCEAARLGHVEVIKAFLEKFPRGQKWKFHLNVAACWAVVGMQPASIDILIKCLEDVEAMEPSSRDICLLFKVLSGDEAIARLFLEKGADVDSPLLADDILTIAERCRCLAITTLLGGTSLNDTMIGTRFRKVVLSHETELDPSTIDFKGRARTTEGYDTTPLWCAVVKGDEAMVEALLEYGANTEAKIKEGKTVLFYAVSLGHGSIVRQLLKHGANKEERDEDGWTLLIAAVSIFADTTDSDMLELLLDEGADVEAKDKDGNTPLMHGAWCLTTAKLLLARGAEVNARSKHGVTPLMKAAFYKENADVVKLFLEHGADPTAKDESDRTAASQANDEAALILLRGYSEGS